MAQVLKAGSKWKSAVCETEVVVIRAPSTEVQLECGGAPMIPSGTDPDPQSSLDPAWAEGTLIGKRYEMAGSDIDIEVLCSKAGAGSLSIGGVALEIKGSKPLPSSD